MDMVAVVHRTCSQPAAKRRRQDLSALALINATPKQRPQRRANWKEEHLQALVNAVIAEKEHWTHKLRDERQLVVGRMTLMGSRRPGLIFLEP